MGFKTFGEFPDLESMGGEGGRCACAGEVGMEGSALAENPWSFWELAACTCEARRRMSQRLESIVPSREHRASTLTSRHFG